MVKKKKGVQEEKSGYKAGSRHAGDNTSQTTDQRVNDKEVKKDKSPEKSETGNQEEKEAGVGLEEILKESEDRYLRLAAEFDNYRKRTLREKAELTKLAGEDILAGLLPVIDDFDRAVDSMNGVSELEALKKGIELIHVKFREFLRQKGVKEIQSIGNDFDTDLHEAVTKIPVSSKKEKGKIVDVIEKGYTLHDKVIRYAKVVVGE